MRNNIIVAVVMLLIGVGLYADITSHRSKNQQINDLQHRVESVEASRAEVDEMYKESLKNLTQTRTALAKANKELNDALKNDEAARAWGDTPIPDSLLNSLRLR